MALKRYAPASALPMHSHEIARLCYVLHGDFEEAIENRQYARHGGMVLFRPAGLQHTETFGRAGAICGLLSPPPAWLELAAEFGAHLDAAPVAQGPAARRVTGVFERECAIADSFSALRRQALLWESIALFARKQEPGAQDSALARRADDYLQAHSAEPVGLSQVARALGVHPGHLARSFRAAYGQTIGARLRTVRAQRAAALIRGTTESLVDIADRCGFSHQAHMTRVFQAAFGVTPGRYRRQTHP
jgi:AraC family transcriptional regulator